MSQVPLASLAGGRRTPPACPTCHRYLTAKLICWHCFDRLCRICGKPTGSACIETCWPCSYWEAATSEAEEEYFRRGDRRPDRQGQLWPP